MSGSIQSALRAANPVPRVEPWEDVTLFAQITALPHDPRQARRHHRMATVVAVALAAIVLLSSTAFAVSKWVVPIFVGPQVTKSEYENAQQALTLPPGYSWPALHIPADTVTAPGAGGGDAVTADQHAWEHYWVKAIHDGDVAAQRRAYDELTALLDNNVIVAPAGSSENWTPPNPPKGPYAVWADDGGLQWVREAYAQAAAGHPEQLIQICRANPLP